MRFRIETTKVVAFLDYVSNQLKRQLHVVWLVRVEAAANGGFFRFWSKTDIPTDQISPFSARADIAI
jgi:hypothetical protein